MAPIWIPLCRAHEIRRDFRDALATAEPTSGLGCLVPSGNDFPLDALWSRSRLAAHEDALAAVAASPATRGIALIAQSAIDEIHRELSPGDPLASNARRLALGEILRAPDHLLATFDDRRLPCLGWVGEWAETARLLEAVVRLASETLPVLVLGGSGTGKELVARGLHALGRRREKPELAINCAELPESVLESELFGHTRGAFTGATSDRAGLFDAAGDGTVFLDEIGELPLTAQAKLLRVLEEHRARRIGSSQPRPLACRIVAATNRDLGEEVRRGRFRADLYYRLRGSEIVLRPLRDRRPDILPLAEMFASRAALRFRKGPPEIGADARLALLTHDWPGNIRELRQTIEMAVLVAPAGAMIDVAELALPSAGTDASPSEEPLLSVSAVERAHIVRALASTAGNKMAAARILGLTRQSLQRRMLRHGIGLAPESVHAQPGTASGNGFALGASFGFSKSSR